jgi:hypothetical protein
MRVTAEAVSFDTVLLQMQSTTVVKAGQNQPTLDGQTTTTQPATTANTQPATINAATTQPATTTINAATTQPATTTTTQPATNSTGAETPADNQVNATYNIDVSKLKVGDKFEVFDKVLDYSIISDTEKTKVTGKVSQITGVNTNTAIQGAIINLKSADFDGCDPIQVETSADGVFSTPQINLLNGGYELTFTITVSYGNLVPYEKTIILGGQGYTSVVDLGEISLWSNELSQTISLSSVIINSIDNTFLPEASVKLYEGNIEIKNENTSQSPAPSFIQLAQDENTENKVKATTQSNSNGQFSFNEVKPGSYTIVTEKDGFYREVRRK